MPKLPAFVTDLADLPEDVSADFYVARQDGDGYLLDVSEAGSGPAKFGLANVGNLQGAARSERKLREKAEKALKRFGWTWSDDDGDYTGELDPEAASTALDDLNDLRAKSGETEEEIQRRLDARLSKVQTAHEAAIGEKDSSIAALTRQLETKVRDQDIRAELASRGVEEKKRPAVESWLQRYYRAVDNGAGELAFRVFDDTGEPRIVASGERAGQDMTLSDLVAEVAESEVWEDFFPDGQKGGAGDRTPGDGPATPAGRVRKILRSDQDAIDKNLDAIAKGEAVVVDG